MADSVSGRLFSDSLEALLALHGVHKSMASLAYDVSFAQDEAMAPETVKRWGDKLGVNLRLEQVGFTALRAGGVPCVLFFKDGRSALIVPQPGKTPSFTISAPGQADIEGYDEAALQAHYSGYALFYGGMKLGETAIGPDKKIRRKYDWFWGPVASSWKSYGELLIASVLVNLFVVVLPLYTMNVYDKVVPNFAEDTLIALSVGVFIVLFFDFIIKTIRSYLVERISSKISATYDMALMDHMFCLPAAALPFSVGEKFGIFRELQTIRDYFLTKMIVVFVDLPFFILFILIIGALSPDLAYIPLTGAALILVLNGLIYPILSRKTRAHIDDGQRKSSSLVDILSGMETVRLFNAMPSYLFRWRTMVDQATESSRRSQALADVLQNFSVFILYAVNVSVVFYGVYEIHEGVLSVGELIACTILASRAVAPVLNLSTVVGRFQHARSIVGLVESIFALPSEIDPYKNYERKEEFSGAVTIDQASFAYPEAGFAALSNVNLKIAPGEKIGFIGQTGAGKTTLTRLITGEIMPQSGTVFVDQCDRSIIHPYSWRAQMGIVPQDPYFFAGSVRDNIVMGRPGLSAEDIEQSVAIAGLDLFMAQSGQGLDYDIGENGSHLSSGQKQALALARAIVHKPQLIVFDEPTNGMDHALEVRVMDRLRAFLEGRTFIMITHRTTLLPLVDRLVLLNKGQIVADGKREDILQKLAQAGAGAGAGQEQEGADQ